MFALLATMHTCANLARKRMTTSASEDGMQREGYLNFPTLENFQELELRVHELPLPLTEFHL